MENIKKAFSKVKEDMISLNYEINSLKKNIIENRAKMIEMCEILKQLNEKIILLSDKKETKEDLDTSTDRQIIQTDRQILSTHNELFNPLKHQNIPISIGNEGASTDRQTDTSTDRQTQNMPKNEEKSYIRDALDIINSLDDLKKEMRFKFKRLTEQEFLVFSTIYQLEETINKEDSLNYRVLSEKLNLTESSIRDYVGRLIKKGIPVEKKKLNNKNIILFLSKDFKKMISLPTLLQLRDL
ncbi:MAG: winged helix-turn-helix transcriptional regulator [Nanoarchaeota archaeon]|nr:winged helix-turn-helix transcriptional regulator [Nanoarchaeota archaeon]MBU4116670.1 winged helix-turn-helix transcriptional regulator [Nanoarchaeota archaeon]